MRCVILTFAPSAPTTTLLEHPKLQAQQEASLLHPTLMLLYLAPFYHRQLAFTSLPSPQKLLSQMAFHHLQTASTSLLPLQTHVAT